MTTLPIEKYWGKLLLAYMDCEYDVHIMPWIEKEFKCIRVISSTGATELHFKKDVDATAFLLRFA